MENENIYKAPEAELVANESEGTGNEYFTTSIVKLVVLSVSTLTIYSLYWFYKHWTAQKRYGNRDCLPVLRAIFQVFFVYSLFLSIRSDAEIKKVAASWSAGLLATYYIIISILSNASDKFPLIFDESGIVDTVFWLVVGLTNIIPLALVQKTANALNNDPEGLENKEFSVFNWIFVALGVVFWGLMFIGFSELAA